VLAVSDTWSQKFVSLLQDIYSSTACDIDPMPFILAWPCGSLCFISTWVRIIFLRHSSVGACVWNDVPCSPRQNRLTVPCSPRQNRLTVPCSVFTQILLSLRAALLGPSTADSGSALRHRSRPSHGDVPPPPAHHHHSHTGAKQWASLKASLM